MNKQVIKSWSSAISEACAKYSKYLTQNQYGVQGICCCAGGALVFDPDPDYEDGNTEVTSQDIAEALRLVCTGEDVYEFIEGLETGFDGEPVGDQDDDIYMAGYDLGTELLAKYAAQMSDRCRLQSGQWVCSGGNRWTDEAHYFGRRS